MCTARSLTIFGRYHILPPLSLCHSPLWYTPSGTHPFWHTPLWHTPLAPPVNRMTNRCKNITLPQTLFAGGNKVFCTNKTTKTRCYPWGIQRLVRGYFGWGWWDILDYSSLKSQLFSNFSFSGAGADS